MSRNKDSLHLFGTHGLRIAALSVTGFNGLERGPQIVSMGVQVSGSGVRDYPASDAFGYLGSGCLHLVSK